MSRTIEVSPTSEWQTEEVLLRSRRQTTQGPRASRVGSVFAMSDRQSALCSSPKWTAPSGHQRDPVAMGNTGRVAVKSTLTKHSTHRMYSRDIVPPVATIDATAKSSCSCSALFCCLPGPFVCLNDASSHNGHDWAGRIGNRPLKCSGGPYQGLDAAEVHVHQMKA